MNSQLIFQDETEMRRLMVQNTLLESYEEPILAALFSSASDMTVLDVGCNDGTKTVERFSSSSVSDCIGLEFNRDLVQEAGKRYGDERFSFYRIDAEDKDFAPSLREIMTGKNIEAFDLIYLSFLLMHLKDPESYLRSLSQFLRKDGKILIIEADDSASKLNGDKGGLLGEFLEILRKDRYAGNRDVGRNIIPILRKCGYSDITVHYDAISASKGEQEKKDAIFTTFFSYLGEDVSILISCEPENAEYRSWKAWLENNYSTLREMVTDEESEISMGMKILTCSKESGDA